MPYQVADINPDILGGMTATRVFGQEAGEDNAETSGSSFVAPLSVSGSDPQVDNGQAYELSGTAHDVNCLRDGDSKF